MSAIQPTDNTGLIVDEFISYATNHLNSVKGTIYTVSLYPPIGTPNVGVLNWTGYSVSPATPTKIVTQDDFKPKEDVEDQNSARPTKEESGINGTTEEQIDAELAAFLTGDTTTERISSGQNEGFKWNQGKPFVQGFRGGGGEAGGGAGGGGVAVDFGDLDLSADWITISTVLIGKSEGFTERATWDVNAYRCGFGTSKIVGSDGVLRDVLPTPAYHTQTGEKTPANGDVTTLDAALKLLKYQITTTFKNKIVGKESYQIPQTTFDALNDRQKAALISYVYNVGSLRVGIATALKAGNLAAAAAGIREGPVTPEIYRKGLTKRRNEEATLFST